MAVLVQTGEGMKWLRLWHDARNDAKLEALTDAQFRVWHKLMIFSSEQPTRGTIAKPIALVAVEVARGDERLLAETLERLALFEIVTVASGSIQFVNWKKRQPPSDNVTARVQEHRERQRNLFPPDGHGGGTFHYRAETPQETDTELETESEEERENGAGAPVLTLVAPPSKRVAREVYSPSFSAAWPEYPLHVGKHEAHEQWQARVREGETADRLTAALRNYATECRLVGRARKFTLHGATFFGKKGRRYLDYVTGVPDTVDAEGVGKVMNALARREARRIGESA